MMLCVELSASFMKDVVINEAKTIIVNNNTIKPANRLNQHRFIFNMPTNPTRQATRTQPPIEAVRLMGVSPMPEFVVIWVDTANTICAVPMRKKTAQTASRYILPLARQHSLKETVPSASLQTLGIFNVSCVRSSTI